jgi:hypothetical protein
MLLVVNQHLAFVARRPGFSGSIFCGKALSTSLRFCSDPGYQMILLAHGSVGVGLKLFVLILEIAVANRKGLVYTRTAAL